MADRESRAVELSTSRDLELERREKYFPTEEEVGAVVGVVAAVVEVVLVVGVGEPKII